MAWSPDGKRLVTPGEVGTVKVWDVAPEELPTLWGHDARVECVAWSPDNTRLASASWDRMVRVWDAATGKELFALKTDRKRALSVAWSPDGKKLATSGLEWTAKIWDAASGASPVLLSGHKGDTTWVTWSPDGKKLATASLDQTAKVWEATSGRELFTLTGHSGRVRRVVWSPDGKLLATAGEDHTIRLWDATTAAPFEGLDWGKLLGWYSNCNRFPATDISLVTTLSGWHKPALWHTIRPYPRYGWTSAITIARWRYHAEQAVAKQIRFQANRRSNPTNQQRESPQFSLVRR